MPLSKPDDSLENRPLKIGIYTNQYPELNGSGGIGTYTRSLAIALSVLGHDVHLLTGDTKNGIQRDSGFTVHCLKTSYLPIMEKRIPGVRAAWQISSKARELTRTYALDIFEFPNWEGAGRFYKWINSRAPMVVRLHTSMNEIAILEGTTQTHATKFACEMEKRTCLSADALFVSTNAHRIRMAEELNVPESQISVLPLGIPDSENPKSKTPRPRHNPPTLLYLGRLETRKGTLDLLNAMPAIVSHVPDIRLVMIGADRAHAPGNLTYSRYFASNFPAALQKHVLFAGKLSDSEVEEWRYNSDALVVPSLYESFGLISIEAMRASLPVIGTRTGGIPEVVQDGINGLLIQPQAPGEIASAVIRLLTDEALRLRLAAGARKTYEDHFSNLLMAARTVDFYRAVIQKCKTSSVNRAPAITNLEVSTPRTESLEVGRRLHSTLDVHGKQEDQRGLPYYRG